MKRATFEFATAGRIIFGRGALKEVGAIAASFGKRAFVVTGKNPDRVRPLVELLQRSAVASEIFGVAGEPTTNSISHAVRRARVSAVDLVIGFGGGSAIDSAKAVAALLTNSDDLFAYLEVIGQSQPITQPPLPCIAIPTTAGTGAEVTRNAVLQSPAHRVKVSLRSALMLPRVAIVDPELTFSLPPDVTAATGLDALTQLIEPYVSSRANPMTDALCLDGMARASRSLLRACRDGPRDSAAREDMAIASLFSGLALANAGLGAVHGFAAPIGGMFDAPHGAVCAALLPHAIQVNVKALRERDHDSEALGRYERIARVITGHSNASINDFVAWITGAIAECKIPPLRAYGITESDIGILCEAASRASSMKANPITLTPSELHELLQAAL
ncbi:MAG: iron-containing alcohol dehydrogenase [Verrucomicrobia subdivision 3 bacterium]|nr:iron-containing alcohol dehydrogenase [Limisphaerales bacterium]